MDNDVKEIDLLKVKKIELPLLNVCKLPNKKIE